MSMADAAGAAGRRLFSYVLLAAALAGAAVVVVTIVLAATFDDPFPAGFCPAFGAANGSARCECMTDAVYGQHSRLPHNAVSVAATLAGEGDAFDKERYRNIPREERDRIKADIRACSAGAA